MVILGYNDRIPVVQILLLSNMFCLENYSHAY
jgi:hypothetical protein